MKRMQDVFINISDKIDLLILLLIVYYSLFHEKTAGYVFLLMLIFNIVKLLDALMRLKKQEHFRTISNVFFRVMGPLILITLILIAIAKNLLGF